MKHFKRKLVAPLLALALLCAPASAARIVDLTKLAGDQPNELVGIGLVFGLKGTGDGGDALATVRPLQQLLGHFGDPIALARELKSANNVALVTLSVSVPSEGAHEGDKLPIKVSSYAAKSLRGGHLFVCPMSGPHPDSGIYALASGDLTLDDEQTPTRASIRVGKDSGATLTEDITMDNYSDGKFTLVLLSSAVGYANAVAIADQINEDVSPQTGGKPAAVAVDATTVVVQIPRAEQAKPAQFIARIQQLTVPTLPLPARIVINSKTKTIIFAGDIELSPSTVSQDSISITVSPPAAVAGVAGNPQGGAKLQDLIDAFNMLKIGPKERIDIIEELHAAGTLRCQLDIE